MKFAKELEEELVPEWRAKYLDYKAGKKRVKAVSRAVQRAEATPRTPGQPQLPAHDYSIYGATSKFAPRTRNGSRPNAFDAWGDIVYTPLQSSPAPVAEGKDSQSEDSDEDPYVKRTPAIPIRQNDSRPGPSAAPSQYGSFVPTPPARQTMRSAFELPDPAIPPELPPPAVTDTSLESQPNRDRNFGRSSVFPRYSSLAIPSQKSLRNKMSTWNADKIGEPSQPSPGVIRRMFSVGTPLTKADSNRIDLALLQVETVRLRQKEFFTWMDDELEKVEDFYKMKEDEAGERLKVLREQLHEMRNRRIEEIATVQQAKASANDDDHAVLNGYSTGSQDIDDISRPNERDHLKQFFDPLGRVLERARAKALAPRLGPNSKALQTMPTTPEMRTGQQRLRTGHIEEGRDYVRREHPPESVSYRSAKRKLKLALKEYYRGLELLKSYALLNRTAFRKINKKYDKAVNAHPPLRYMSEKVNKAWFVKSEVVDNHLHTVEDLYARYFEKGNHKVATGKLRSSSGKRTDKSWSAFTNGLLVGIGAVFLIQTIVYAGNLLFDSDPTWRLLLAGLYPVEFRDFFLGDMYCSLTYLTGNLSLFFCLYANQWDDPTRCNSSHSRVMGFFSALPSVWRALQSLRRYHDTRNAFPHLANFGKYTASIMYYVTLSLYRIDKTYHMQIVFCIFACVNAVYSSIWDLVMDWSLLQPHARQFLLRDIRGYKSVWWYYGAMILDVILRFNWILYAIFTHDLQHSTLVSFFVAMSEATRRGIWAIFRVENEHCSNVAHFKASRDVPLPYMIEEERFEEELGSQAESTGAQRIEQSPPFTRLRSRTSSGLEAQESPATSSLRRRPGLPRTITKIMADAHTQDFEKKRKPSGAAGEGANHSPHQDAAVGSSDDEDDDDDEPDLLEVRDAEMYLRTKASSDKANSENQ
ncbi:hypothetical protein B7463_g4832, partial [Scytalidium lignicola]